MRRDFKSLAPHVYLFININTGNDEEHPWTPGPTCEKTTKAEDDRSLIFLGQKKNICIILSTTSNYLDNFDKTEEGEGHGDQHQEQGEHGQHGGADTRTLLACWHRAITIGEDDN